MERMNKKSIRKTVLWLFMAAVLFSVFILTPLGWAGTDLDDAKSDLSDVKSDIKENEQQIKENNKTIAKLTTEIKELETDIYATEVELNNMTVEINGIKEQITLVMEELTSIENDMLAQTQALEARLRAMYKNGDAGMLSVLLGSSSMTELLTNIEMVKKVYSADNEVLETLAAQYETVEEKNRELETLRDELLAKQEEIDLKNEELNKQKASLESKKKAVSEDNEALEAQIDALNKEADALTKKILTLQSSGDYIGGSMCWPAKNGTRITSSFGYRMHPILKKYKFHSGIDIGVTGAILAANSGKVITSAYNSSYGYYIMIDHGGGIVTLYAHCKTLYVTKGDTVLRGQTIAIAGTTGMSTGVHLHFEVRVNGKYQNPLDYVTPGKYYYD